VDRSELESKHLAELHALAVEAGVPGYRMLSRSELVEKLAEEGAGPTEAPARGGGRRRRPREQRPREGRPREERPREGREERPREERPRERRERRPRERPQAAKAEPPTAPPTAPPPAGGRRKRRRRRFRRRRKELRLHELLLPPTPGRQTIVYGESRDRCTALLRELAAGIGKASKDIDPVAVLVDPSPEELADWRRDAPGAEIVAASQARHVEDALAQAANRAAAGEDVIVLLDSLTRFVEAYGDAEAAEETLDVAPQAAGGSLTVVAALERAA
jgi:transcription termination factor Rho